MDYINLGDAVGINIKPLLMPSPLYNNNYYYYQGGVDDSANLHIN